MNTWVDFVFCVYSFIYHHNQEMEYFHFPKKGPSTFVVNTVNICLMQPLISITID